MVYYGKNVPFPNVNLFNDVSLLLISFYKRDDMLGSKKQIKHNRSWNAFKTKTLNKQNNFSIY